MKLEQQRISWKGDSKWWTLDIDSLDIKMDIHLYKSQQLHYFHGIHSNVLGIIVYASSHTRTGNFQAYAGHAAKASP